MARKVVHYTPKQWRDENGPGEIVKLGVLGIIGFVILGFLVGGQVGAVIAFVVPVALLFINAFNGE